APEPDRPALARLRWGAVAVYGVAALVSGLSTGRPEETFRYGNLVGFYDPEAGGAGTLRWTPKAFAVALAPGASRRLTLVHYTPDAKPVSIEAFVEGRLVFGRPLAAGESAALRLTAPPDRARVVLFRLSRAFVPKSLGLGEDRRQLGL